MRLGVFGGTFDPVHLGHLLLAESCRESCRLDRVWFVPAGQPPHKTNHALTPAEKRIEMLKLAIGGHEAFDICRLEIDRPGPSYSYETLAAIRQQQPGAELFFLMGSDSLADLPTWREPAKICELAELVVVRRAGAEGPDWSRIEGLASKDRIDRFRRGAVEMPLVDIKSRDIRRRVAEGRSIRFMTPRAVEVYVQAQGLYLEQ
ncbi:MAG: nicotinate-nucleotide adenylyltransferase [Planctomycetia bacterium]|nr:nicotinate-nucleotide adenylyltransferase [Planctomycetia bacterium]